MPLCGPTCISHLQLEVPPLIGGPTSNWRSHLLEVFFIPSGVITILNYIKNNVITAYSTLLQSTRLDKTAKSTRMPRRRDMVISPQIQQHHQQPHPCIHQVTLNTQSQSKWTRCGHKNLQANCPTYGKMCYNCGHKGHFMSLSREPQRQPREQSHPRITEDDLTADQAADQTA